MKAIVIKLNDKVVFCESLKDLTLSQFNDLHKEAIKTIAKKDEQIVKLENEIARLGSYCEELNQKLNYLGKQIAIDRGEIEEDSEEEYVITIEKIHHEQPQTEEDAEIVEPLVSEEEDTYFEEKEESEVSE